MPAYLVRLSQNHELVGIFVSASDDELATFVDECCDPFECEFVKLPPGGIYLDQSGAPAVPTKVQYPVDEPDIPDWFRDATVSELWLDLFYSKDRGPGWQPIEPND